jgi:hypothetical protein
MGGLSFVFQSGPPSFPQPLHPNGPEEKAARWQIENNSMELVAGAAIG